MSNNLQLELIEASSVSADGTIVFDTVLTSSGAVSYDNDTGTINLSEAGYYKFDWWVVTQSSNSTNGAVFAVVSSQGDSIVGASTIKTGEVVGNCIIEVISPPVTVELKNASDTTFYFLPATPVKAGLTVIGEAETGPTGPTGPQGEIGPTGPQGDSSPAAVIPFSSGSDTSNPHTNASGEPTEVQLVSFSGHSSNIQIAENAFALPTGNNYQFAFAMPYNAVVKSIYLTCANWADFTPPPGALVYPFVMLATAPINSNSFTLLTATQTETTGSWVGGVNNPAGTTLSGSRVDIDVPIPAGSRVAICCTYRITGTPSAQDYYFYYAGGILLG